MVRLRNAVGFKAKVSLVAALSALAALPPARAQGQVREEEIVANLATGRVIVHVAKEAIVFATIEQPGEIGSIPPRIVSLDSAHVGIMFGAAEWLLPAQGPKPVRLERRVSRMAASQGGRPNFGPEVEADLEITGEAFLEALRSFANQLHHKIQLGRDEPLFELVVVGYGPNDYGPEVWLFEYRAVQEEVKGDYMQTRILRPRTTQLYPPEKHQPRTLVEVRYPADAKAGTLLEKIQGNDLVVFRIARAEEKFLKVVDKIQAGRANTADAAVAADFLRAVVVPLAGNARFTVGKFAQQSGLDWLVPPSEPLEKAHNDKDRPADAPTLMRKP